MLLLELLESKATQADTNLLEPMPVDVNWNHDFEAFQVTGNFVLADRNSTTFFTGFIHIPEVPKRTREIDGDWMHKLAIRANQF